MDRDDDEAARAHALCTELDRRSSTACPGCSSPVCGHSWVLSTALGFQDRPRCARCLAAALDQTPATFFGQMSAYIAARGCFHEAWRHASRLESLAEDLVALPCLRLDSEGDTIPRSAATTLPAAPRPQAARPAARPPTDQHWNAGDLACGDLVLELRLRLRDMAPGAVLEVRATDSSAREDMPAWCSLTGHTLVLAQHPDYWIRRRSD